MADTALVSKYTLHVSGEPIEGAAEVLEATGGFTVRGAAGDLVVVVDASTMAEAEARLNEALPSLGTYSVSRPEPLEDEDD
jgi:hypothetical protein